MVLINSNLSAPSRPSVHIPHHRTASANQPAQTEATRPATSAASSSSSDAVPPDNAAPDFRALFTGVTIPVTAQLQPVNSAPTPESVFGPDPWLTNPTGNGPAGIYSFNPLYFATPQTAAKVAHMLGGTVVESNELASGGGFSQQQPNQMVRLPNGRLLNAGIVASFYTHGYPQSYIDQLVAGEINA